MPYHVSGSGYNDTFTDVSDSTTETLLPHYTDPPPPHRPAPTTVDTAGAGGAAAPPASSVPGGPAASGARRGHYRSSSHGSWLSPGPSILKMPDRVSTLRRSVVLAPDALAGSETATGPGTEPRPASRRGHARAFSHGQMGITEFGLRERQRSASTRSRGLSRSGSLFGMFGPIRQVSRTESIYTLRTRQQSSSVFDYLCFWRRKRRLSSSGLAESQIRHVVPNHSVPLDAGTSSQHPNARYCHNQVRTTKYTLLSFLPKNLFEQFHRFANLYFLFIILLNWVPEISAFGKEIAMLPLLFVMGVTALKDVFEDRRRYKSDRRVNYSTCRVYDRSTGGYVQRLWQQVRVGDIVHLQCDELIPADLLLLSCSDQNDVCYVDTGNLDGETNLKSRRVVAGLTEKLGEFDAGNFHSTIECNAPTTKLYRFFGSVIHSTTERVPVSSDNLLLRECVLKNTDFVEGIVVYAGHDTKALLNNGGPRYKRSRLERLMNIDIIFCVFLLFILCFVGATGSGLWLRGYEGVDVPFLVRSVTETDPGQFPNPAMEGFTTFWTFVIILQILVPVSLYVTLEIIKLAQVYHINNDRQLYDSVTDRRTECRALNITEELGQVQYVFSDKTGTLTENQMVFRHCTINGVDYNHSSTLDHYGKPSFIINRQLREQLQKNSSSPNPLSPPSSPHPKNNRVRSMTSHPTRVREFFLLLSCCNTVVVAKRASQQDDQSDITVSEIGDAARHSPRLEPLYENIQTNSAPRKLMKKLDLSRPDWLTLPGVLQRKTSQHSLITLSAEQRPVYEAESPDEMALVEAAYKYDVRLIKRSSSRITVSLPDEGEVSYQILHVLPFDSDRKRMSIILRDHLSANVFMFTKGADTAMIPVLSAPVDFHSRETLYRTQQQLNIASKRGLRVLVMAKRELSDDFYSRWLVKHQAAEASVSDREYKLAQSYRSIECSLTLLGCTGVEDRLQDGVPETLSALRAAGIMVWVLTGDKQETAINIAYSCQLFSQNMEIIKLNTRSRDSAERSINFYLNQLSKSTPAPVDPTNNSNSGGHPSDQPSGGKLLALPTDGISVHSETSTLAASAVSSASAAAARALVIDGKTLTYLLDPRCQLQEPFLRLASQCAAVMCCRTTPLQKAYLVRVVKHQLDVLTLAIGDGANDVSMIQTADVGVGISGLEGRQAVMASDFSVARFRFLCRLLLVHGHWCYERLAKTVQYFLYKNATFVFVTFWYQIYCGFSGTMMFDQIYWSLFNLFFTSLPPFAMGIYDQNCSDSLLLSCHHLYSHGRLSRGYQRHSFWLNMLDALFQSVVIFFIATYAYYDSTVGIWEFGTTVIVACLFTMLLHASIEIRHWTWIHAASIFGSVLVFFLFAVVYNSICLYLPGLAGSYWVIVDAMNTPIFYLISLLSAVVAVLPRFVLRVLQNTLRPSTIMRARIEEQRLNKNNNNNDGDSCDHQLRRIPQSFTERTSIFSLTRDSSNVQASLNEFNADRFPTVA